MSGPETPHSASRGADAPGRAAGWLLALIGWTIIVSFYQLDGGAAFEPTDAWLAQTAREMRQRGDWLMPYFAGEPRLQKSPGPYWAVMLASLARGTNVDVTSARLPNAAAAVVIVASIFLLTRRIAGTRAAVFAGFAAASSAFVLHWSHRANSEMGLAACVTVAVGCLWAGCHETPGWPRGRIWLLGYFAAGLGMLYKMPMPLVCVGLPAVLYIALRGQWRALLSGWHLAGLLLLVAPWLPWVIAVVRYEPGAVDRWRIEYLDRFTGDLPNVQDQGGGAWYLLYLIPTFLFTLPYCLSLPGALLRGLRRQPGVDRDGTAMVLIWFFSLFAFFTAATGKEIRYFLPALPPLFVLLGVELAAFFDPARRAWPKLERLASIAVWILAPAGCIGGYFGMQAWHRRYSFIDWNELAPAYVVTAAIVAVGLCLSAWLYVRRRSHASFGVLVATMWLTWFWAWPKLMPLMVSDVPHATLAAEMREKLAPYRARLRNVGQHDPRLVWLSDLRFPRLVDPFELLREQGGRRSLERERRANGEAMVRALRGEELALLVITRVDYISFLIEASHELAEMGESLPPVHLWLQTRHGPQKNHLVVIGNQPPPWPEPPLTPPSERLARELATSRPATSSAGAAAASTAPRADNGPGD